MDPESWLVFRCGPEAMRLSDGRAIGASYGSLSFPSHVLWCNDSVNRWGEDVIVHFMQGFRLRDNGY